MTSAPMSVQQRSLTQQGYDYSPAELSELSWGLRFTPGICMLIALYGLATQQAWIHFTLAAIGIVPFWFPAWHPFDVLYNRALRPLWNGVTLPPNPLPRRIACVMGGAMNFCIGVSFSAGSVTAAYIFGAILIVLQLIVITTHFCVASWMYEGLLRMLGRWAPPMPVDKAKALVQSGALLVDVRAPDEFARGHLPDAINLPVDGIEDHAQELREKDVVLYCQSGLRSQRALQVLKKLRLERVHNFGAMSRWT